METLNIINAMATNKKVIVATIVKMNKAAGTCGGRSIKPSETGGSTF